MRRLASELFASVLLLTACATYDDAAPLSPHGLDDTVAGKSSSTSGGSPMSSSGAGSTSGGSATGGAGAPAGGSSSPTAGSPSESGGSPSGSGGSALAGTDAGGGGNGGSSGAGGSGGQGGGSACAMCAELKAALAHRYDFEGTGAAVMDRVGTAHGTVQGGGSLSKLDGKGVVVLTGGDSGPYVDLPNHVLSALTSATLETWVTWGGGDSWQRIFDFGDTTAAAEYSPGTGKSYLFLTPQTDSGSGGTLRAVYSRGGGSATAEIRADGSGALPQALTQVVVVVDPTAQKLLVYMDGQSVAEQAFTASLSELNDVNAWLGRSQYDADPELKGTLHDFRIYGKALTAAQIAASFAGGADPAFLSE